MCVYAARGTRECRILLANSRTTAGQVRRLCDAAGALYIADEVQTGLGRCGRGHLWAVDCFGVVPDIMVIGKGLSGGVYPIAATCMTPAVAAVLRRAPFAHVSTFGGSEVLRRHVLRFCDPRCDLPDVHF